MFVSRERGCNMFIVSVKVTVKPEHIDDFIQISLANARGTRQEPGNIRFDLLRSNEAANEFMLYEIFRDEEAMRFHQQTEHYLAWRDAVADWMAEPRKATRLTPLFVDGVEV